MGKNIYIQLLDKGTAVYRLVPARQIENNIYEIEGFEIYDLEVEGICFKPGRCITKQFDLLTLTR